MLPEPIGFRQSGGFQNLCAVEKIGEFVDIRPNSGGFDEKKSGNTVEKKQNFIFEFKNIKKIKEIERATDIEVCRKSKNLCYATMESMEDVDNICLTILNQVIDGFFDQKVKTKFTKSELDHEQEVPNQEVETKYNGSEVDHEHEVPNIRY